MYYIKTHYGGYIAYHKNSHISTNVQRQKLSIAACELACCNASPQGRPWPVFINKEASQFKNMLSGPSHGGGAVHLRAQSLSLAHIGYTYA